MFYGGIPLFFETIKSFLHPDVIDKKYRVTFFDKTLNMTIENLLLCTIPGDHFDGRFIYKQV